MASPTTWTPCSPDIRGPDALGLVFETSPKRTLTESSPRWRQNRAMLGYTAQRPWNIGMQVREVNHSAVRRVVREKTDNAHGYDVGPEGVVYCNDANETPGLASIRLAVR